MSAFDCSGSSCCIVYCCWHCGMLTRLHYLTQASWSLKGMWGLWQRWSEVCCKTITVCALTRSITCLKLFNKKPSVFVLTTSSPSSTTALILILCVAQQAAINTEVEAAAAAVEAELDAQEWNMQEIERIQEEQASFSSLFDHVACSARNGLSDNIQLMTCSSGGQPPQLSCGVLFC